MLKKGTFVYLSEYGHKRFIYPSLDNSIILEEDAEILISQFFWQNDPSYKPYLIKYKNEKLLVWTENKNV